SDPEHLRATRSRKHARVADVDLERFKLGDRARCRSRDRRYSIKRDVAEELQRQMNVLDAAPTRCRVRNFLAQPHDVFLQLRPHFRRQLNRTKYAPRITHLPGVSTSVSFAAFVTASKVNG